jgi:DNA-binding NarL/FixJ family response regulator
MHRIEVLCVDDHRVVLHGIELLLGRYADISVVASATTGEDAVRLFRQHQPDVTLMDLQLPSMSGLDAIRTIRREYASARVIVLTMFQGDEDIHRALQAGAVTYLLKDALSDELVRVIREVHAGERPIPPNITALLDASKDLPRLTDREVDVVQLIARGMRNKEIAFALGITEQTAKVHVKNILAKLNVSDRTAVVAKAVRRGIIHIV